MRSAALWQLRRMLGPMKSPFESSRSFACHVANPEQAQDLFANLRIAVNVHQWHMCTEYVQINSAA